MIIQTQNKLLECKSVWLELENRIKEDKIVIHSE